MDQISRNLEKALSISDKADDSTPLCKPRQMQSAEIQCEILKGGKVSVLVWSCVDVSVNVVVINL